jgi:CheY-like chemotaxis protein/anti-sigma regulatory factor (Ser/Thr protein kinase)
VDDDRVTRQLNRAVLEAAGHAVTTAASGSEGLDEFRRQPCDLLLVDVWMPGMNGLELLGRLRAEKPDLKAVVLTADGTPETLLYAIAEQAYAFVKKPVTPALLVERVSEALAAPPGVRPIQVLSAKPEWIELLVPCDRATAGRIQEFMAQLDTDMPPAVRDSIGQAFHELLMNAVEWGGKFDPNRFVRIATLRTKRMILYRIQDPGEGFRFDRLDHSAVGNAPASPDAPPLEHVDVREQMGLRPGGFGLLMAQALVDELIYNERQNEVVFVKYLNGAGSAGTQSAAPSTSTGPPGPSSER